jgi:hypothetical protein
VFVIAASQPVSVQLDRLAKFKDDVIASLGHQTPKEGIASISSLDCKLLVRFDGRCHFGWWIFVRREQGQFPEIFILTFNLESGNEMKFQDVFSAITRPHTFSF